MAKQRAGGGVPPVPRSGSGQGSGTRGAPQVDGKPVSPAVARSRRGAAAGQGHGSSDGGGK